MIGSFGDQKSSFFTSRRMPYFWKSSFDWLTCASLEEIEEYDDSWRSIEGTKRINNWILSFMNVSRSLTNEKFCSIMGLHISWA
jgi:hypothetical protein